MIERGAVAKFAKSVFFEQKNDFDIYIEDTAAGYDKIFSNLLHRTTAKHVSLQRVFPLGSRREVLEAAERESRATEPRRLSVFIVDGDFFLLHGELHPLPPNVVRLPRYCIENFITDGIALTELADEEDCDRNFNEISRAMDFSGWLDRSLPCLRELFITFAIAQSFSSGIKTVSHRCNSICGDQRGEIDQAKATALAKKTNLLLIEKFGEEKVKSKRMEIEKNINQKECFISTYVSAKDFSLPLLLLRLRNLTGTKSSNISLKLRLSKNCSIEPFLPVVKMIETKTGRFDIAIA